MKKPANRIASVSDLLKTAGEPRSSAAEPATVPVTGPKSSTDIYGRRSAPLNIAVGVILGLAVFTLYMQTLAPTVAEMFSDTLELQLVPYQLGIAHPTGYPLYTLLGKVATLLPFGDIAFRLNLMSAFWGAAASTMIYAIVVSLTGDRLLLRHGSGLFASRVGGIVAALFFATSPIFWSQSVVAEVYSLNAFLILAFVWTTLLARSGRLPVFAPAFVAGLGLTHHRTFALFLPAAIIFLWVARHEKGKGDATVWKTKRALMVATAFLLPLTLYVYLPWRGMTTSSLDGMYQNTLSGFLDWVTGRAYTVFLADNPWHQTANPLTVYLHAIFDQFGGLGLALGILGVFYLGWRDRAAAVLLAICYLGSAGFAVLYRVADVEPFFIPSFLAFSLWIGVGAAAVLSAIPLLATRTGRRSIDQQKKGIPSRPLSPGIPSGTADLATWALLLLVSLGLLSLPVAAMVNVLPLVDKSDDRTVREYGEEVLSLQMPLGSTLVSLGGENTLFQYLQETEGRRRDLVLVRADVEPERLAIIDRLVSAGRHVYTTHAPAGLTTKYSLSSLGNLIAVQSAPTSETPSNLRPVRALFEDGIQLLGLQPLGQAVSGEKLKLTLFWQAQEAQRDLTVYVHLLDADGNIVAQSDQRPVRGAYPTNQWRKGEVVADSYELPLPVGLPPGEYRLLAGLYESATGRQVGAAIEGTTTSDGVSLGKAAVLRPPKAPAKNRWPKMRWAGNALTKDGLALVGLDWGQDRQVPGGVLDVISLWQASGKPAAAHQIRLRLNGQDVTVDRRFQPADGAYPTDQWTKGEVVRLPFRFTLPADLSNGAYRLSIGLDDTDLIDVGDVTVHGRDRILVDPKPDHRLDARLGQLAMLTGFDLKNDPVESAAGAGSPITVRQGAPFRVVLHWQALANDSQNYKVFVHLISADGHPIAQDDSEPMAGAAPTSGWKAGEFILDEHRIDIPANVQGETRLIAGMYDPTTGRRLPSEAGDSILLASVTVN